MAINVKEHNSQIGFLCAVAAAAAAMSCLALHRKNRDLTKQLKAWNARKDSKTEEQETKNIQEIAHNQEQGKIPDDEDDRSCFKMYEIGTITSPYPHRAGTPRQGLLAPNSRSILTLHADIPKETLDGLEMYSHVWIIFQFHLNPIGKGRSRPSSKDGNKQRSRQEQKKNKHHMFTASKIKPPRAGGQKVG